MPRLFVAVDLPDRVRDRLLAVRPTALPGVQLTRREDLHLTLHFIGEIGGEPLGAVRAALAGVRVAAFSIGLRGVGRFPPEGPPQVLWAGLRPNPPLSALREAVGTALAAAVGFRPEDRPYKPHVTLARLTAAPPPGAVEQYLDAHADFDLPDVPVARFCLYTSVPREDGPRYSAEAAFELSGPASRVAGEAAGS
jgi:2'-5' RNA ligase